jgi:hypothetical protein
MYRTMMLLIVTLNFVFAETVSLDPVADTFTTPSGGCHGTEETLDIANKASAGHPDERTMLVFDLSDYAGRTLISATLNLNAYFQCPSGTGTNTQLFAAEQAWDETWSGTHVSHTSQIWQSYHFLGLGWHHLDVTDLVAEWLSGSFVNHGFVIQVDGVYPYTRFHSRETSNSPYLTLEMEELALGADTWAGIKSCFQD